VIAVDVCCACVAVAERLDEDVLGGVIEAARPVEPEVALFGAVAAVSGATSSGQRSL